jgi:hypothetical protein
MVDDHDNVAKFLEQKTLEGFCKEIGNHDNDDNFCLCPATVCVCSRNPIGTAVTVFVVGDLVWGENLQWRKPLSCGELPCASDHEQRWAV